MRNQSQRMFVLFFIGAILGPIGDFFHFVTQTNGYPIDSLRHVVPLLGNPLWVPPLFGIVTVCIGLSHVWLDKKWPAEASRPGAQNVGMAIVGLTVLMIGWAVSGFAPLSTGGGMDALLAIMTFGAWFFLDRTLPGAAFAAMTAAGGVTAEFAMTRLGIFYWSTKVANFHGLPSWIIWLYALISIAVGNISRIFSNAASVRNTRSPLMPS